MPRVLIVDDEPNQRRALSIGLRLSGFEVSTAASAVEALEVLRVGQFDIAMIDLMMPGLNGLELAKQLRTLYPAVPVVLTSAYHLSERQLARADVGVVGFVPKPCSMDELAKFLSSKIGCRGPTVAKSALARLSSPRRPAAPRCHLARRPQRDRVALPHGGG